MSKHAKSADEKVERNELYKQKYRQRLCKGCGHRSSQPGSCIICGAKMADRPYRKR